MGYRDSRDIIGHGIWMGTCGMELPRSSLPRDADTVYGCVYMSDTSKDWSAGEAVAVPEVARDRTRRCSCVCARASRACD
eukprot:5615452-Pleurochrysis_carterae.AAC.1